MRSKSVLVSMAVMIILSLGLVPIVNLASNPFGSGNGSTVVLAYFRTPDYHILAYSYNTYGQPVIGTLVNVTLTDQARTHQSSGRTNSSGYASWTIAGDPLGGQIQFAVSVDRTSLGGGTTPQINQGEIFYLGGNPLNKVVDPADSSRSELLFAYEGSNGSLPAGFGLYYNFSTGSGSSVGAIDQSKMTFLGDTNGYVTTLRLPQVPPNVSTVALGAFGPGGQSFQSFFSSQSIGGSGPVTPKQVFTTFTSGILSLVVPLMAILVAYASYGKDKATGVLESVLARPVTRRGLGLTRYVAIILSISVALVATMAVMEVISQILLGSVLDSVYAATTVGSLIVEGAAFVGITMLLSHLLKSTGSIIGVGIGLWILLDFFWSILILVGGFALGVQVGSGNYFGLTIESSFLNPAQFYSLVSQYLGGTSGGIAFSPATYGLTPLSISLAGAIWVLAPLFLFLRIASHRD
jgi:ABC-2 type transport system permease protein